MRLHVLCRPLPQVAHEHYGQTALEQYIPLNGVSTKNSFFNGSLCGLLDSVAADVGQVAWPLADPELQGPPRKT